MSFEYFTHHPLRLTASHRHRTIQQMEDAYQEKASGPVKIKPATGAYIHYGGVELADKLAILKPPVTSDELQDLQTLWDASCGFVCRSLLFYVWKIVAKEHRHGSSAKNYKAFGDSPTPAQQVVCDLVGKPDPSKGLALHPNVPIGPYMAAVEHHYRKAGWTGAYGGAKWADITVQIKLWIDGKASAMLAADRCWTLVHNTGPIFNKGFNFAMHNHVLMTVLNTQASSSVLLMPTSHLETPDQYYQKFVEFKNLAVTIIKRADPDYFSAPQPKPTTPFDGAATKQHRIGMLTYAIQKERHHG